jgi:Na+-transporting methylmalonyl-CoA/oxaloacetate decarboxylase gamma subunit
MSSLPGEFLDSLVLLLTGMAFVMLILWLIYGICYWVGLFFKIRQRQTPAPEALPASTGTPSIFWSVDTPMPGEDLMPLIAATVDRLMEGAHYRILRVHELSPTQSDWAREGRRTLFTSHRIR